MLHLAECTITARLERKLSGAYFKEKEKVLCEAGKESMSQI